MKTSLVWFGAALVLELGACGGKVVVDQATGSGNGGGGAGPTSSNSGPVVGSGPSSVNGTGASTSTGPGCGCQAACDKLLGCGASVDCGAFCAQVPADTVECICNAQVCDFDECVSSSGQTTSGSSGPSGAGGAGGGIPADCATCVSEVSNSQCAMQQSQCTQNAQCSQTVQCMNDCAFTNPCIDMCLATFGGGGEFYSLVSCSVCGECFDPCLNSSLIQFCLDG